MIWHIVFLAYHLYFCTMHLFTTLTTETLVTVQCERCVLCTSVLRQWQGLETVLSCEKMFDIYFKQWPAFYSGRRPASVKGCFMGTGAINGYFRIGPLTKDHTYMILFSEQHHCMKPQTNPSWPGYGFLGHLTRAYFSSASLDLMQQRFVYSNHVLRYPWELPVIWLPDTTELDHWKGLGRYFFQDIKTHEHESFVLINSVQAPLMAPQEGVNVSWFWHCVLSQTEENKGVLRAPTHQKRFYINVCSSGSKPCQIFRIITDYVNNITKNLLPIHLYHKLWHISSP